ncbi:MAG: hypothetical protein ABJP45_11215 [Cyclobacteriaceae bacterium]
MEKLSVIIARDAEHVPSKKLARAILNQSLDKDCFELILVLFTDEEKEWIAFYEDLKHTVPITIDVVTEGNRASLANQGLKRSNYSIVLFLADDFVPCHDLFKLHLDAHRDSSNNKLIVFGPGISPAEQRDSSEFLCWLEDSGQLFGVSFTKKEIISDYYFYMANASVWRDLINLAGGFNEKLKYNAGDDYELGLRMKKLGAVSQFCPNALAIHDHPLKEEERYKQLYLAGFSAPLMSRSSFLQWLAFAKGLAKMVVFFLRHIVNRNDRGLLWRYKCQRVYMKGSADYFLRREKPV